MFTLNSVLNQLSEMVDKLEEELRESQEDLLEEYSMDA